MHRLPPEIDLSPNPALAQEFPPPGAAGSPWVARRPWVFTGVLCACLTVSLAYVWLRQPIYQSSASVSTVARPDIDQTEVLAGTQHLTVQQRTLLSVPMLEETQRRLRDPGGVQQVTVEQRTLLGEPVLEETRRRLDEDAENKPPAPIRLTVDELRDMLSVAWISETNIVELRARGSDPAVLAPVVNAWIEAYEVLRGRAVRESKDTTSTALHREFDALGLRIEAKREALDRFRREHEILSENDGDNQARARLTSLNAALSKASDDEVKAKAKLDAVRDAIARGKTVVRKEEELSLSNLEHRAQQLREQVKDLRKRYTAQYIALQPQLKIIPEQLEKVEAEIQSKTEKNRWAVLNEAEQDYAAARQTVEEIRRRFEANKHEAAEFTMRFTQQKALVEELAELEKMYRETQARLVHVEVKPVTEFPQMEVVERGYTPRKPLWPDYWRDSGIAVAGSLTAALLVLLVYDFVLRREGQPASFKLPDIRIFSVSENLMLRHRQDDAIPLERTVAAPPLPETRTPVLEGPVPRELTEPEIRMLLNTAELGARQCLGLLLSGLTLEEAVRLGAEHCDLAGNHLLVDGARPRSLPLAPRLKQWLLETEAKPVWAEEADIEADDLLALIACAATDSGLPDPDTVDAEALRHTYLVYLVRQGIRLADLERVAGKLPVKTLAAYARYSPAGPGLRIDAVPLVFPPLRDEDPG